MLACTSQLLRLDEPLAARPKAGDPSAGLSAPVPKGTRNSDDSASDATDTDDDSDGGADDC